MATRTRTCGAPTSRGGRCTNPLKAGELRCHLHQNAPAENGSSSTQLTPEQREQHRRALASLGEEGRRRIVQPPQMGFTPLRMSATLLSEFTPIDPELSLPLVKASERLLATHDYTVPANVNGPQVLNEMVDLLHSEGVPVGRMSLLRLQGFHRRNPRGMVQSVDMSHEALVLDRDQRTETVVDPGIATFAPVRNRNIPIEEQMLGTDRNNPLIDVPWVSSIEEYVYGDYLWWDRAVHLDLNQRTVSG